MLAERSGIGLYSWSPSFQNALWRARELGISTKPAQTKYQGRASIHAQLGQTVLEKHLPVAQDLPFEELINIREKRRSELAAFRVGIGQLASQIDPTHPPEDIELEIHDLVLKKIDPAVQNLRSAMKASRLDALKNIGRSWDSLAKATIPAILSFAAGAPLEVSAAVGGLGGLLAPILEAEVERKKIQHASQWSILIRARKNFKKYGA